MRVRTTSFRHLIGVFKRTPTPTQPPQEEPPSRVPEETLHAVLQTGITIGERRERNRLLPQASIYNSCDVCGKPLVEMLVAGVPFKRCPDNEDSRHHSGPIPRIANLPPIPHQRQTIAPNPTRIKGAAREAETKRNMVVSRLLHMKDRDRLRVPPSMAGTAIETQQTVVVPVVRPVVRVIEAPAVSVEEVCTVQPSLTLPSWCRASNTSALTELEGLAQTAKLRAIDMRNRVQAREARYQQKRGEPSLG